MSDIVEMIEKLQQASGDCAILLCYHDSKFYVDDENIRYTDDRGDIFSDRIIEGWSVSQGYLWVNVDNEFGVTMTLVFPEEKSLTYEQWEEFEESL